MLKSASTAVSLIKAVPWNWIVKRLKVLFSLRISIVGPENSGKTTLKRVLYNQGNLVSKSDYRRTRKFDPGRALFVEYSGSLGSKERIFRNIFDTPGQRHRTVDTVVAHIVDSRPRVLVFVVDCSRPFQESEEQSERDSSKWFGDLISRAEHVDEGKEFRAALAKVKLVVLMLNKANKVHDEVSQSHDFAKDKVPSVVSQRISDHEVEATKRICALMVQGKKALNPSDVKVIPSCFVKYDGKSSEAYDKAHMELLVHVHEELDGKSHD